MSFHQQIAPVICSELELANRARRAGDCELEYQHLQAAHVLGQSSTRHHARVHWLMLQRGLRMRSVAEVWGQTFRLIGAATKTFIGLVPEGNTGATDVSAFRSMPISAEHKQSIQRATKRGKECKAKEHKAKGRKAKGRKAKERKG